MMQASMLVRCNTDFQLIPYGMMAREPVKLRVSLSRYSSITFMYQNDHLLNLLI